MKKALLLKKKQDYKRGQVAAFLLQPFFNMEEVKTASDLLGPLVRYSYGYLAISLFVTVAGALVHYVKKCIKFEADWSTYWSKHKRQTTTAVIAMVGSYFTLLLSDPDASLLTFMAVGYAVDSMFNKAPPSVKAPKRRVTDGQR